MSWKTKPSKQKVGLALAISAGLALTGCSQSSAGPSDLIDVSVYLTTSYADWAYQTAVHEGYFEEEGLNVTLKSFNSGADASVAFAAEDGDFVQAGDLPALVFASKNPVRVLANTAHMDGGVIMVASEEISDVKDLAGGTIGAALESSPGYWIDKLIDEHALEGAVEVVNIANPDQAAALGGGSLEAVVSFPSTLATFLEQSNFHMLDQRPTSNYLMMNGELFESDPELAERFLAALAKGAAFIDSETEAAAELEAKAQGSTEEAVLGWLSAEWEAGYQPKFRAQDHELLASLFEWGNEKGIISHDGDYCDFIELGPLLSVAEEAEVVNACD